MKKGSIIWDKRKADIYNLLEQGLSFEDLRKQGYGVNMIKKIVRARKAPKMTSEKMDRIALAKQYRINANEQISQRVQSGMSLDKARDWFDLLFRARSMEDTKAIATVLQNAPREEIYD